MQTVRLILAAVAASALSAAHAAPFTSDEARAAASQRNTDTAHAAALRNEVASPDPIRVVDTDTARAAASQTNTQRASAAYVADVRDAGRGSKPAPVRVTDTDSARAAAAQASRQETLVADYQDYLKLNAQASN